MLVTWVWMSQLAVLTIFGCLLHCCPVCSTAKPTLMLAPTRHLAGAALSTCRSCGDHIGASKDLIEPQAAPADLAAALPSVSFASKTGTRSQLPVVRTDARAAVLLGRHGLSKTSGDVVTAASHAYVCQGRQKSMLIYRTAQSGTQQ